MISQNIVNQFLNQKLRNWGWIKNLSNEDLLEEVAFITKDVPGFKFKTEPFKHQLATFILGVYNPRFLWFLSMGLGKSKIVLDILNYYKLTGKVNKTLVLVPSPISIESFREQIEIHSDFSHVALYGVRQERWNRLESNDVDIYVLNFAGLQSMLMEDDGNNRMPSTKNIVEFSNHFDSMVIDEIHNCKSLKTLNYKLSLMVSRNYYIRMGLTGTPMNRDPMDLWTQFNIIDGGETLGRTISLYREAFFKSKINYWGGYEYVFDKRKEPILKKKLLNKSIRYSEFEVQELPELVRRIIRIQMPPENRGYYQSIVKGLIAVKGNYVEIDAVFVRLRQICSGFLQHKLDTEEKATIDFDYNPKLEALMDLIRGISEKHKIVIFHEFIHSGHLISKELKKNKLKHVLLSGATKDKIGAKNEFVNNKSTRIFVVNSKSGGTALNLQIANYVIYFESPVSAIVRSQSEKRCHRTGQTKRTFIYDLIVGGSIEEKVLEYVKEGKNLLKTLVGGTIKL